MENNQDQVTNGVAFIMGLPQKEFAAFKALFRGARFPWTSYNGGQPFMGKAECEWVEDWRTFYGVKLRDAGLFYFIEAEPEPALGMAPGSTFVAIDCGPTDLGFEVYDEWLKQERARNDAALSPDQAEETSRG